MVGMEYAEPPRLVAHAGKPVRILLGIITAFQNVIDPVIVRGAGNAAAKHIVSGIYENKRIFPKHGLCDIHNILVRLSKQNRLLNLVGPVLVPVKGGI